MRKCKRCPKCRGIFGLSSFGVDRSKKDGRHRLCRFCVMVVRRKWHRENRTKSMSYTIAWRKINAEYIRKYSRERYHRLKKKNYLQHLLAQIKQRCSNPKSKGYSRYGGRGIKCLLTHDELKQLWKIYRANRLKKPSIDRIDPDGDYSYFNCRFVELSDNSREGQRRMMELRRKNNA